MEQRIGLETRHICGGNAGVEVRVTIHGDTLTVDTLNKGTEELDNTIENLVDVACELQEFNDKSLVDLVLDIVEKRMSAGEEDLLFKKLSER